MKKLIVVGIVMAMVMGLAAAASAAAPASAWTVILKVGQIQGYDGTGALPAAPTWTNNFNQAQMQLTTAGSSLTSSGNFGVSQVGMHFGVAADPAKRIVTVKKAYDAKITEYTWDMTLETGSNYSGGRAVVGWFVPAEAQNFAGWTIKAYQKNGENWDYVGTMMPPTVFSGTGVNGSIQQLIYTPALAANTNQSWRFVASVPEPGSMLAMLSGLVGLVGFGIRRRK